MLTLREERRLKVFQKRLLRRIFGPKRDKVTREWRKLHNEKLNDLYSLNIVRVIKLSKMKWAGHVAHTGERRGVHRWGNLTEGDRLEDAGIDRRIILRWIFRKWGVGAWNGSS